MKRYITFLLGTITTFAFIFGGSYTKENTDTQSIALTQKIEAWDFEASFDLDPTSYGFSLLGISKHLITHSNGIVRIDDYDNSTTAYLLKDFTGITADKTKVIEILVKVNASDPEGGRLRIYDTVRAIEFGLSSTNIMGPSFTYSHDMTQWTTIRIEVNNSSGADIYVNDSLVGNIPYTLFPLGGGDDFLIGDNASSGYEVDMEIDYINYTLDKNNSGSSLSFVSYEVPQTYVTNLEFDINITLNNPGAILPEFVMINGVTYNDTEFSYSNEVITVPYTVTEDKASENITLDSVQIDGQVVTINETLTVTNESPRLTDSTAIISFVQNGYDVASVKENDVYKLQVHVDTPNTNFYPAELGLDGQVYEMSPADLPATDDGYVIEIPFTNSSSYGDISHHVEYVIMVDETDNKKYDLLDNAGAGWFLTLDIDHSFTDSILLSDISITEQVTSVHVADTIPVEIAIIDYDIKATDFELTEVYVDNIKYNIDPVDIVDNKVVIDVISTTNPSNIGTTKTFIIDKLVFEKNFGTVETPDIQEESKSVNYSIDILITNPITLTGFGVNNSFLDKDIYLSNESPELTILIDNPNEYTIDYLKLNNNLILKDFTQSHATGLTTVLLNRTLNHVDYRYGLDIVEIGIKDSYNGILVEETTAVTIHEEADVVNYYFDSGLDFDRSDNKEIYIEEDYVFVGEPVSIFFEMVNPDEVEALKYMINEEIHIVDRRVGNLYEIVLDPFLEPGEKTISLASVISSKNGLEKEKVINESIVIEVFTDEFALDTSVLSFRVEHEDTVYWGDTIPLKVAYNTTNDELEFRSITINGIEYDSTKVTANYAAKELIINVIAPNTEEKIYNITEMSFTHHGRVGVRDDYNKNLLVPIEDEYERIRDNVLDGEENWLFDSFIPYWDNVSIYIRALIVIGMLSVILVPVTYFWIKKYKDLSN